MGLSVARVTMEGLHNWDVTGRQQMTHATQPQGTTTELPGAKAVEGRTRRPRTTVRDQQDVLRVLGVLKVATATQIMELVRPHLSDNKPIRNALLVLQADGKVVSEGSTAGPAGKFGAPDRRGAPSQKLWGLTPVGLDAAAGHLQRGPELMGGRARGAGTGGAPHAMAVNDTVVAFTRGGRGPGAAAGIGSIDSWRTEVAHPLTASGKRNVRADAVFQDKAAGLPLLIRCRDRSVRAAYGFQRGDHDLDCLKGTLSGLRVVRELMCGGGVSDGHESGSLQRTRTRGSGLAK